MTHARRPADVLCCCSRLAAPRTGRASCRQRWAPVRPGWAGGSARTGRQAQHTWSSGWPAQEQQRAHRLPQSLRHAPRQPGSSKAAAVAACWRARLDSSHRSRVSWHWQHLAFLTRRLAGGARRLMSARSVLGLIPSHCPHCLQCGDASFSTAATTIETKPRWQIRSLFPQCVEHRSEQEQPRSPLLFIPILLPACPAAEDRGSVASENRRVPRLQGYCTNRFLSLWHCDPWLLLAVLPHQCCCCCSPSWQQQQHPARLPSSWHSPGRRVTASHQPSPRSRPATTSSPAPTSFSPSRPPTRAPPAQPAWRPRCVCCAGQAAGAGVASLCVDIPCQHTQPLAPYPNHTHPD